MLSIMQIYESFSGLVTFGVIHLFDIFIDALASLRINFIDINLMHSDNII